MKAKPSHPSSPKTSPMLRSSVVLPSFHQRPETKYTLKNALTCSHREHASYHKSFQGTCCQRQVWLHSTVAQ
ncbi:hypothetical protein M404DRAFT_807031 [Pisolithus tinctorius Marx 270]|uniref:Uncharacterized protein n=1 Tax=Pisolithus tinctorius Marx 270 TaxID=870435 RepID=A0A0C3NET1_PISTI|nr:hypothetical protein M404DRAFT_807031 [Pisolithus tinctorius Marx 270]